MNEEDGKVAEPSEAETEARRDGWLPKDEFKGPASAWVDAETFVHRGKEINSLLRKSNERLEAELKATRATLEEQGLAIKEFSQQYQKMQENAYKRARAELRKELVEAKKEGDVEKELAIEEQIEALKEPPAAPSPKQVIPTPPPNMEEFNAWHKENQWYNPDKEPEMFDSMEGIAIRLRKEQPELTGRAFLEEATKRVKTRYPDKFGNPRRNGPPMVEAGGKGGGRKGEKGYEDLPEEARATCDRFVKSGFFKGMKDEDARRQYAKDYFAAEAV